MRKKLNIKYALSQFSHFTLFGSMVAFLSVFLLGKGFDNTTIGLTLSIIGIVTIIIQTLLGDFLDKNKDIRLQDMISFLLAVIIIGSSVLYFFTNQFFIMAFIVLVFSIVYAIEPLQNSMAFLYNDFGIRVNYGFARGMGSLAFAMTTALLGSVFEVISSDFLPLFYAFFAFLSILAVRSYRLPVDEQPEELASVKKEKEAAALESDKNMLEFAQSYKKLFVMMFGVVLLFFGHVLINNFFIQIITPIGGSSQTMGIAVFIGAIVELPAMLQFERLAEKVPIHRLLKISAVFFLLKHFLTFLAPNLWLIYLAQFLQIAAFAIAYPALVEYTQLVVSKKDLVKGQSLLASAIALSNILSSFSGGVLLDSIGVSKTLFVAVITTVGGLLLVFFAVEDQSKKSQLLRN
ncbi:MAG: MFS transporter [Atopostipes suicloacalis]|nr:MFS transporter [Atopostipes suicloacalis]